MHRPFTTLVAAFSFCRVASWCCGAAVVPFYEVTIVAPPERTPFAVPLGISPGGTVVGYGGPEAWTPLARALAVDPGGSARWLATPTVEYGFAYDADDNGVAVGTYDWRPVAWVGGELRDLAIPEGFGSAVAHAIAPSGLIAGSFADFDDPLPPEPVGPRPCTWSGVGGAVAALPMASDEDKTGSAFDVNEAEQIAGAVSTREGYRAAVWDTPTATPRLLGPFEGSVLSEARAINERGDVTGRVTFPDFSSRAFIVSNASDMPPLLPILPGGGNYAEGFDISEDGWVVGMANAGEGIVHAVVWIDRIAIDLNDRLTNVPAGTRYLSSAVAMAKNGVIAAEAVMEGGFGDSIRHVALLRPVSPSLFRRGDANADASLNIGDAIFVLGHLFGHGDDPQCRDSADANDDGQVNIADAIKILAHLFGRAGPLPDPFEKCGPDPSADDLGCAISPHCP